jgi:hypothetical protein
MQRFYKILLFQAPEIRLLPRDAGKSFHRGDTKREAITEAKGQDRFLRFFELASVFVRLDHVTSLIVNANHSGVRTAVKLRVALVRNDSRGSA